MDPEAVAEAQGDAGRLAGLSPRGSGSGLVGVTWVPRVRDRLLHGARLGPPGALGRGGPVRRPGGTAGRRLALRGGGRGGRPRPGPGREIAGTLLTAARGLVFPGRPLYHLPLRPEVVPSKDSPRRSVRPGALLSDQRRSRAARVSSTGTRIFAIAARKRSDSMKVILADDVRGLGHRGDTVSRSSPATPATSSFRRASPTRRPRPNIRKLGKTKKKYDEKMLHEKAGAESVAQADRGPDRRDHRRRPRGGRCTLYGSVTPTEIADALAGQGIEVDRRRIELAEPIKRLGEHRVHVRLHRDVTTEAGRGRAALTTVTV